MTPVSLHEVITHTDVPTTAVRDWSDFQPERDRGVSKYRAELPTGAGLNALLINQGSDVLVVAFHGATNRQKKQLPRFEWMRTLRDTEYSSLYFSDPCLELDDRLELAWYTGWKDFDLYPILADWIQSAAQAVGASKVLMLGSSGGGLASLQVSTLVPGSMALPFSAQTSIGNYLVQGTKLGAQRSYIRAVMPHLRPNEGLGSLVAGGGYFDSLGERASALLRYERSQPNFVYYVQNRNDLVHVEQHYRPFREAIENGPNSDRVRFELQEDREGHNPPLQHFFHSALQHAVDRLRELT